MDNNLPGFLGFYSVICFMTSFSFLLHHISLNLFISSVISPHFSLLNFCLFVYILHCLSSHSPWHTSTVCFPLCFLHPTLCHQPTLFPQHLTTVSLAHEQKVLNNALTCYITSVIPPIVLLFSLTPCKGFVTNFSHDSHLTIWSTVCDIKAEQQCSYSRAGFNKSTDISI